MKTETHKLFESIQQHLTEADDKQQANAFIRQCKNSGQFDDDQLEVIKDGFKKGFTVDQVKLYAKPELDDSIMRAAKYAIEKNYTQEQIDFIINNSSSHNAYEVYRGIGEGLNTEQLNLILNAPTEEISEYLLYAIKKNFTPEQLNTVANAGENVEYVYDAICEDLTPEQTKYYTDPRFNDSQRDFLLDCFKDGITSEQLEFIAKPEYSTKRMKGMYYVFDKGLDSEILSYFTNPDFNDDQIDEMSSAVYWNLTPEQIKYIANPDFNDDQMYYIRYAFEDNYTPEQIKFISRYKDRGTLYNIRRAFEMGLTIEQISEILNSGEDFEITLDKIRNPVKHDGSKYYYLLSDGYLQEVEKDSKYYDDDPSTWTCYNAETIKTARKFKSYDTADKFLDKRYDTYTGNYRIEGLSDDTQIVSLNQLISGEVSTSTDLLSYKNTINPAVDNTPQEEPEETDDTLSDEFSYTLTAEDGKTFTYTEPDYKNPEEAPYYEDMPIWDEVVEYSNSKGFTKIVSTDADRYLTWTRDEDGDWEFND